ncbi:MAG TPA: site-2 protease family protein [Candidatus Saccharimonadales bacterium]|jgi:Zn-dependent protease/predicted transcriptional regulator|nr:site-2 protease family protein [Candidatus Saccharimonadales bacterium]
MRKDGIQIGRIYGIPIFLHTSWFIIFGLIAFSFVSEFDALQLNLPTSRLWGLGLMTSALFFGSLVFHEMAHSIVAKFYKIPVVSITLFVFGGVSRIGREPSRAIEEFNIAIAGPLSSFFLAGGFWLIDRGAGSNAVLSTLAGSLAWINFSLALFNLIPGFPLDGGHIFRAIVWSFNKDYARATTIAARSGQVVGIGMIAAGAGTALANYQPLGGPVGGLWLAFIGWFILSAAKQSQAQAEARGALEGLKVADIMTPDLQTVGREISLEDYAREMVRTGRRAHLVVAGDQLVGLVTAEALNSVPQHDWDVTSVQAVMLPKEKLHWAAPEEPALTLLDRMRTVGMQQMPVIAGGSVVGIVTRDSILRVLQSRHAVSSIAGR